MMELWKQSHDDALTDEFVLVFFFRHSRDLTMKPVKSRKAD